MTARRMIAGAVVVAALIAPLRAQGDRTRERDPAWVAPAGRSAQVNPLTDRPELSAGGRRLFKQRCSECHGLDRRGTTRAPDLISEGVQEQSDGALFWKISSGNSRTGMPSFSFLPEPQRWQVVLFLRSR